RVAAGEYWRLLTAPWLHGGVDHLVGNGIALFILGMLCEAAFGRAQFVLLYVLSGLAGSLVSLAVSAGPSVGASGAIFGLQGAAIVLFRLHRDRLLVRDRRVGLVLLVWAIYSIVAGLMEPFIDNGAHIRGALAGARRLASGPFCAACRAFRSGSSVRARPLIQGRGIAAPLIATKGRAPRGGPRATSRPARPGRSRGQPRPPPRDPAA